MKEFLDLGDNVIDTNLKIDNLGRKIYKKLRKKRSHQFTTSTYGAVVSCESRNRVMNIRQLKRLIKEAIFNDNDFSGESKNSVDLLSKFKISGFNNYTVDSGEDFIELENDYNRVVIKLIYKSTIKFMLYSTYTKEPVMVFEVRFGNNKRVVYTSAFDSSLKTRTGLHILNGQFKDSEILNLVYNFLLG
jgi:hypothetical protein